MSKLVLHLTERQRDNFHKQLGYVRCWVAGYEAGSGKSGPHATDQLRHLQILLGDAKPEKSK